MLDVGLLFHRLAFGGIMLISHGWGKLSTFEQNFETFPDPLGLGSGLSLTLVVGAEFFCAAAIVLGLATRLAAIPLMVTMSVAAFVIHAADPWMKQEFPLLFLAAFTTLLFTGPGRFSIDRGITERHQRS